MSGTFGGGNVTDAERTSSLQRHSSPPLLETSLLPMEMSVAAGRNGISAARRALANVTVSEITAAAGNVSGV